MKGLDFCDARADFISSRSPSSYRNDLRMILH
jgi:hypothetical protein